MSLEDLEKKLDALLRKKSVVGSWKQAKIAASGTLSDPPTDLGDNFAYLQVSVPTITAAELELQVSDDGIAYQDFGQDVVTPASVGGFNDTWKVGGWRFIRVKSSATQASAVIFLVRGVTY